jgi:hypothetical protein
MIPALAVFASPLHTISWKFLPTYALGLCPSDDFPVSCESHFKTGFFIAEKVVDALRLINRSKKRDGIALPRLSCHEVEVDDSDQREIEQ